MGKTSVKQGISEQVWFISKTARRLWVGGSGATSQRLSNFYPYLKWETNVPTFKLPQNYWINMNIASLPSFFITYTAPEEQPSQSDKT